MNYENDSENIHPQINKEQTENSNNNQQKSPEKNLIKNNKDESIYNNQSQRKWKRSRSRRHNRPFIRLLKKLSGENKQVSIIINSGENCCKLTGCIGRMICSKYITIITDDNNSNPDQTNSCNLTHIKIKYICAISVHSS